MKKIMAAAAAGVMLMLTACSSDGYTDTSMTTLRYEKGDTQGGAFHSCVQPGEKIVTNDALYPYPNNQREVVFDSDKYVDNDGDGLTEGAADYPDLEVVDKNGVVSFVKMKVSFFLNTDCKPVTVNGKEYKGGTLQAFHELVGKTRKAYFDEDGSYGKGWVWAMDNYVSSSITDYMVKAARDSSRDAESMWLKSQESVDMQNGLAEQMPELVNAGMETDLQFYENFTVKIYSITPEGEFLNMYKQRQQAQVKAETAELNRQARVAEAKANAEVAREEAKVKLAEISGYGGFENYRCIYLADKGLNCAQPTYVMPGVRP